MTKNDRKLEPLAFASCALIWGSTFLFISIGNDTVPPLWGCTMRLILAGIILNSILLITGKPWPRGDALRAAFWYGFWDFGVNLPLLYWGEKVVPSGLAAVIYATSPVMAMVQGRLLALEDFNVKKLAAALLALSGVGVIFWREILRGGSPLGLLAIFVAVASATFSNFMLKRGPTQSAIASNAVGVLVGAVLTLTTSVVLGERLLVPTTLREAGPIVYLAVAGSVGAFVIFAWLLNTWKTSTMSFLGIIVPVIAVIFGSVVRNEKLAAGSIVGAAIVIAAVAIALRSDSSPGPEHRSGKKPSELSPSG